MFSTRKIAYIAVFGCETENWNIFLTFGSYEKSLFFLHHYLFYQTSIPSAQQSQPSINYNSSIQLNITNFAHNYTDKIHINNHNYT